ncbi:MAG: hypothetical protein WDW36_005298 [Sanguina aurantia]
MPCPKESAVVVDTSSSSVSHLGKKLPALLELNLNNSVLESIRDLGTGFTRLEVLWVSRCGLSDVEGLSGLPSLRELYAAYNDIHDLQPIAAGCESLELLDVEGNCVACVDSVAQLQGCENLTSLVLSGNPVCNAASYRAGVIAALPQLTSLDDEPTTGPSHHRDALHTMGAAVHETMPAGWATASGSGCSSLGDDPACAIGNVASSRGESAVALDIALPPPLQLLQHLHQTNMSPGRALLFQLSLLDLGSLPNGGGPEDPGCVTPASHNPSLPSLGSSSHQSPRPLSPSVFGRDAIPSFVETESRVAAQPRNSSSYAGMADATPAASRLFRSNSSDLSSELSMVLQGIKHARVGLDSQEFQQMDLTGTGSSAVPNSSGGGCGEFPRRPPSAPSSLSSMLPAGASTWMRGLRGSHTGSPLRCSSSDSSGLGPAAAPAGQAAIMSHRSRGFGSPPSSPKSYRSLSSLSNSSSRPQSAAEQPHHQDPQSLGGGQAGADDSSCTQARVVYAPNDHGARCGTAPGSSSRPFGRPASPRSQTRQEAYHEAEHLASGGSSGGMGFTAMQRQHRQRPFSARPATASVGAAGSRMGAAGQGQPRPDASLPAPVGLYWSKHRQQALQRDGGGGGGDSVGGGGLSGVPGGEAGDGSSAASQLTRGSEGAFGGSLAKDLRRWKGTASAARAAAGAAAASLGDAAAGAEATAGRGRAGSESRVGGEEGGLDHAALLQELRAWKVQTADTALMDGSVDLDVEPEEGQDAGEGGVDNIASAPQRPQDPGGRQPQSSGVSGVPAPRSERLRDPSVPDSAAALGGSSGGQSRAREALPQVRPPSARPRPPSAATAHAQRMPSELELEPGQLRAGGQHQDSSSRELTAAIAGTPLPSSPTPGSMNPAAAPRHAIRNGNSKMLLRKVVRDVGAQPLLCSQPPSPGQKVKGQNGGTMLGLTEQGLDHSASPHVPSSRQLRDATACLFGAALQVPSHGLPARHQTRDASEALTQSLGIPACEGGWSGVGQSRAGAKDGLLPGVGDGDWVGGAWDGLPQGKAQRPYQVVCASGEVDLAAANPRPRPRPQPVDDSGDDSS